ncbi:hypothetical protein NECAME_00200 [Necator americanus]|uniref:Uncharacterized protein n=1 Tax=Necator americanus TaxID=51031 RepID=W2TIC8_NECAM|nr:hypothetical protein NECAME_00200 [Necator americanus]ETN81850.1 hypothetical protein NECAME_00200 [Necator americanus]
MPSFEGHGAVEPAAGLNTVHKFFICALESCVVGFPRSSPTHPSLLHTQPHQSNELSSSQPQQGRMFVADTCNTSAGVTN